MVYTENQELLSWLGDMITLTCPNRVVWIDGTTQQIIDLCGGFVMIQSEPIPDSAKYICSLEPLGGAQWIEPPRMAAKMLNALSGSMKGKDMYVLPYAAKNAETPLSGVLITDSAITVAAMSAKCRIGNAILDEIGCFGHFIHGVQCSGGEMCLAVFPEDGTFMASGMGDEYSGTFADYIAKL